MRVLVACEWSNTVRDAFLRRGHDAYSCDLIEAEHPNINYKRSIRSDVRPLLKDVWDLVIAHPPCTYLCNSGVWLLEKEGQERAAKMLAAIKFFFECLNANAPKVCVENPRMHKYARQVVDLEPTQVVRPYEFGHPDTKATCLWLRGLPPLKPTKVVQDRVETICGKMGSADSKERSRTYSGIARAMAEQWG